MCCSPQGRKESDMTEQLNRTIWASSPYQPVVYPDYITVINLSQSITLC